jgi:recombination protein RecR
VSAIDDELTSELSRLPGIGRKTALRLTYHLLKRPPEEVRRLARALDTGLERVRACTRCGNLTEADPCDLCTSPRRDASSICVVEEASDIMAIERTGEYSRQYHVLGGRLSPLDGVGPEELNVASLLRRVQVPVTAAAVGTAGRRAGDRPGGARSHHRDEPECGRRGHGVVPSEGAQPLGVRVTRLARGLPVGGDLEYADGVTIAQAFAGRREL